MFSGNVVCICAVKSTVPTQLNMLVPCIMVDEVVEGMLIRSSRGVIRCKLVARNLSG